MIPASSQPGPAAAARGAHAPTQATVLVLDPAGDAAAESDVDAEALVDGANALSADEPLILVSVAPFKLRAHLSLQPSGAGRLATAEQVGAALLRAGVVHGILHEALDAAVALGTAQDLLVAEGEAAVDGEDAKFETLLPDIQDRKPKIADTDPVDFRELGLFASVSAGAALMRRTPATPGTPGMNVLGQVIPAKPGRDQPFSALLKGAMVDPNDCQQIVAAITGLPVRVNCGVNVEPVLTVEAVDMHTGHIDFVGSVHVLGDVRTGMKVHAQGDITVGGVVESAEIVAKGNITIVGGVIGHSEWKVGVSEGFATAKVVAGGTVSTRFAEHAIIEAGSTIHALDASRQSLLRAIQVVSVGKGDGRSGHIIGGRVVATMRVSAGYAGSSANVPTLIEVGRNPLLVQKLEEADERRGQLDREKADVMRLLAFAKANPQRLSDEVLQKARLTAIQIAQQIDANNQERQYLDEQAGSAEGSTIVCGMKLFGGVTVRLGDLTHRFTDERAGGTLRRVDNAIHFD